MPVGWVPVGAKSSAIGAQNRRPAALASSSAPPAPERWNFLEDMSAPVPTFVTNLKLATGTVPGRKIKKTSFTVASRQLTKALETCPAPGPYTFAALCIVTLFSVDDPSHLDIGHLIARALDDLDESFKSNLQDLACSKMIAAKLVKSVMNNDRDLDQRLLVRLVTAFGIGLSDLAKVLDPDDQGSTDKATKLAEGYILKLVEERSYTSVVALLKGFGLMEVTGRDVLVTMVRENQVELAAQWANHLGPESCRFVVDQCIDRELFKAAYKLVQRFKLENEYPDSYYAYRRNSVRKLVSKGLWTVAETVVGSDRVLQEYLISLALGKKQHNRVSQFREVFHLEDLDLASVEPEVLADEPAVEDYIQIGSVVDLNRLLWVDDAKGLQLVTARLSKAETVGLDCEWKAVTTKGEQAKVSILQLGSKDDVFVLDVHKLSETASEALNQCIKSLFQSEKIIKLGYAVHNDLEMLAESFPEVEAFRSCNMIIDLQCFPDKLSAGGLSGLTKLTMGKPLDKDMRMTDWSHRPLSKEQLHYAALDAAVLPTIHKCLCSTHDLGDQGRSCAKQWEYQPSPKYKKQMKEIAIPLWVRLNDLALAVGSAPVYETVRSGKIFKSSVTVAGQVFRGTPSAKPKCTQASAAKLAIAQLSKVENQS